MTRFCVHSEVGMFDVQRRRPPRGQSTDSRRKVRADVGGRPCSGCDVISWRWRDCARGTERRPLSSEQSYRHHGNPGKTN